MSSAEQTPKDPEEVHAEIAIKTLRITAGAFKGLNGHIAAQDVVATLLEIADRLQAQTEKARAELLSMPAASPLVH